MRETVTRGATLGLGSLRVSSFFRRFRNATEWLRWILVHWVAAEAPVATARGRRILSLDATTFSCPGSPGTDYRLHYALEVMTGETVSLEITDQHAGETLRRFELRAGDIVLGDRLYANPAGVAHGVAQGADVVVRLNTAALPLYTAEGERFDLASCGRRLRVGSVREYETWVHPKTGAPIRGRLTVLRLTKEQMRQARRRLRRRASRLGVGRMSTLSWALARYLLVWTTLGKEWSTREILDLYRARWQIELAFKRLKSLLGLGGLPKKDAASARSWLYAKLVLAMLVEKIIAYADARSSLPAEWEARRSRWKEFGFVFRELGHSLLPAFGLLEMVQRWEQIKKFLIEERRQRRFQMAC